MGVSSFVSSLLLVEIIEFVIGCYLCIFNKFNWGKFVRDRLYYFVNYLLYDN